MRPVTMALLSTAFLATPALAQSRGNDAHSGFHASVGLGSGSLNLSGNGSASSNSSSLALMLRFGGAIQPGLVLSGELTGWSKQKLFASWATAVVQWYPQATQGFYVKGGVGVATFDATECCAGSNTMTTDLGLEAGTGFDFRLSRGFFLTPYADFLYAAGNGSKYGVNLSGDLFHVGLAVSWR